MRTYKKMTALAVAGLVLLTSASAGAAPENKGSGDDRPPSQRPPQAYYVPDQDELQQLPSSPPGDSGWGWLRRALSGPGRLDPGRDDPNHDPNLDQGP